MKVFDKILYWLSFVVIAFAVTSSVLGQSPLAAKARWVYIASTVTQLEVVPTSDECENCGGTGKLGDGTVERVCPVCDGTGKRVVTPPASSLPTSSLWPPKTIQLDSISVVNPHPVKHAIIEYYGNASICPSCRDFINNKAPNFIRSGWTVQKNGPLPDHPMPTFRVWQNGKSSGFFSGVLDNNKMLAIQATMAPSSQKRPPSYTYNSALKNIESYRPKFSWPNDLRSHLAEPPHNLDASRMTQDEMEIWHDNHHAKIGPR